MDNLKGSSPSLTSAILHYPATDFVCWSKILYVRKLVADGWLPMLLGGYLVI